MKILILGDVMGSSGREAINKKLPNIIKNYKTDFIIVNGENAADDGRGITKEIAEEFITKDIDAVYGDLVFVKDENDKKPKRKWISNKYKENLFSTGWIPPHPTFYAKLDVYERYGLFNSNLKFAADFDIMCRFIAREQIRIKYLPGTKVRMRLGGATTKSIKNIILGNIEIYNSLKNNRVKISPLFFFKKVYTKLKQFK